MLSLNVAQLVAELKSGRDRSIAICSRWCPENYCLVRGAFSYLHFLSAAACRRPGIKPRPSLVGVEADGVLGRCGWLPVEFLLNQLRPIEAFAQLLPCDVRC